MICITAEKDQACMCCERAFKKGELIFQHPHGLICADECGFSKDLGVRRQAPSEPKAVKVPKVRREVDLLRWASEQCHREVKVKKTPKANELEDVMGDKLRQDINKLGGK